MEPGKPILFSKSFLFVKKIAYFSTTRSRFWIRNGTQDLWTVECALIRNRVDSSTLDGPGLLTLHLIFSPNSC